MLVCWPGRRTGAWAGVDVHHMVGSGRAEWGPDLPAMDDGQRECASAATAICRKGRLADTAEGQAANDDDQEEEKEK